MRVSSNFYLILELICHLINDVSVLADVNPIQGFEIHCANRDAPIFATQYGKLSLRTETNTRINLEQVFYVKELSCNLISISRIMRNLRIWCGLS